MIVLCGSTFYIKEIECQDCDDNDHSFSDDEIKNYRQFVFDSDKKNQEIILKRIASKESKKNNILQKLEKTTDPTEFAKWYIENNEQNG